MTPQGYVYVGVALLVILGIGLWAPKGTIWILVLILLAALITRGDQLKALINGG